MNNAPGASAISAATRQRVLEAATRLDYRPNPIARSLRTRQTFTIGVIVPEFSEGYFTTLMNGIEESLLQSGYLHYVVTHQGKPDLIDEYPRLLSKRSVDGFLLVNTSLKEPSACPSSPSPDIRSSRATPTSCSTMIAPPSSRSSISMI